VTDDPYTRITMSVRRLIKEYKEHGKLIVALDFDDTVFDFHKVGSTYPRVLDLAARCSALGFYIVLFTGGDPKDYGVQKEYLARHGVIVSSVNCNPIPLPFGNHGKPYYNILLDDRAGLGEACTVLESLLDSFAILEPKG
jgi:hypothetical protein